MSTITLPNIRVSSDLTVGVVLKDGGVAIDWSTLSNIKAYLYADAQRAMAGRCSVAVDEEDSTRLVCSYRANKPQYIGVNRIVITCTYRGETKTFDKPALNFVRWTDDQAGQQITIDDPDVDVEIEVEDVSSSILEQAIAAALQAAADAEHAAHLIPNQVLLDCEQATAGANAAAEAANAAGITSVNVSVEDNEPGTPSAECALVNKVLSIIFHYLKGETGDAAGFGAITATVDDVVGDPSVTVTASGPDTAKVLAFAFHGLRGIQGVPGVANAKYKQVDTLPTASADTMDFIYLTPSGTSGVYDMSYTEQDGSTFTWRDLGTTAIQLSDYATKAELSQLEHKVDGEEVTHYTPGYYLTTSNGQTADADAGYSDYIPYTQGKDVIWRFDSETVTKYNILFYDDQKQFINGAYWGGTYSSTHEGRKINATDIEQYAGNAAFIRVDFTLGYSGACVIIDGETVWTPTTHSNGLTQKVANLENNIVQIGQDISEINGEISDINDDIDGLDTRTNDINTEIDKALIAFDNTVTPVDFRTGATDGKYLKKDTAEVLSYASYSISAPIHLLKGQKLVGVIKANDVTVLAETNSTGTEYSNILNNQSANTTDISYYAERDMYVAVCYLTSSDVSYLNIESTNTTLEDIATQVKENTEAIASGDIPDFVLQKAETTFARFQKWKGSDKCLVFPIITDLHANPGNLASLKPNDYIVATDRIFGYNFIADLGDIGLGNDASPTEEKALTILNTTAEAMNKYIGKFFFVQGNHDSDFKSSLGIGQVDVDNYLGCVLNRRYPGFAKKNDTHQCYYADFEDVKIRIFCINTTDKNTGGGYGMTAEQLGWIYANLLTVPNDYSVLFLSHFCVMKIGEWKSYISSTDYAYGSDEQLKAYANMLSAFANKTAVTYGDYSFDFTGVDSSIKLIGNICGDSHFDAQLARNGSQQVPKIVDGEETTITIYGNGVNYIITQSYGPISNAELPSWGVYTPFDKSTEVLIDVVAIKPGEMKLFRIGAGGSARDRAFTF